MNKRIVAGIVVLACWLGVSAASAQVYGPAYPPPGGVTLTPSGNGVARAGGQTWAYSTFTFTDFKDLYYGVSQTPILSLDSRAETLAYNPGLSNLPGGVVMWTGPTGWCTLLSGSAQTITLPGRMTVTVTSGGSPVVLSPAFFPTPTGSPILSVTGDGLATYTANYLMEVQTPAAIDPTQPWVAAQDFFDNGANKSCPAGPPGGPGPLITDLNAGFWNTDYPITASSRSLRSRKGQPFNLVVSQFSTTNPSPLGSNFTVGINWGDGTPSTTGTVTPNGSGGFDVTGSHTYANYGGFAPALLIKSIGGSTATVIDSARMWPKLSSH